MITITHHPLPELRMNRSANIPHVLLSVFRRTPDSVLPSLRPIASTVLQFLPGLPVSHTRMYALSLS